MKTEHRHVTQDAAPAVKKTTAFEKQVAKDWRRFKEKYFACTEYPAVRRALKKILAAEEKEMADAGTRTSSLFRGST